MISYGTYAEIRSDAVKAVKAPVRMRVSEAASRYVTVNSPGGYQGPYDPDLTPYMVEPMDTLAAREYEAVVFVGPARSSKTQSLVDGWYGYAVMCDPGDMGLYFPVEGNAKDYSKRRLNRLNKASDEIRAMISPRSHDDNLFSKTFRNGMLVDLLWPTSSRMAQRDMRYVVLSDYDSMPEDVDGEGEPFALALKRVQTFMSAGMCMAESSPKKEIINPKWTPTTSHEGPPAPGIMSLFNRGDRRRRYWPCVECDEYFIPTFDRLWYPEIDNIQEAAAQVQIVCPSCGCQIGPEHKTEMDANGAWVRDGLKISKGGIITGEAYGSSIASFWLHGPNARFQTWESIVLKYLQAKAEYERTGSEKALKTTVNVDQGSPYLPISRKSTRTADELISRAIEWTRGTVPEGVRYLLATVDVQGNRFEVLVTGYGIEQESWIVDRFALHWSDRVTAAGEKEPLDPPGHQEDWTVLNALIGKEYPLGDDSGRRMAVHFVGVDSGGKKGVTTRALNWWRSLRRSGKNRNVRLIKGEGDRPNAKIPRVRETYPDSSKRKDRHSGARGDVPMLILNTNELKDALNNDLTRKEEGPGFVHLPSWLEEKYFAEIVAETRTSTGWKNIGSERNETWDLLNYGKALNLYLGVEKIDWKTPPKWAAVWDRNSHVSGAESTTKKPVKKQMNKRGFGSDDWSSRL